LKPWCAKGHNRSLQIVMLFQMNHFQCSLVQTLQFAGTKQSLSFMRWILDDGDTFPRFRLKRHSRTR